MNEYNYGTAPVYKIDDIPAYKAGEWPGIKSNKFENTRRIIQAVEKGIFFSENEPVKNLKKRMLISLRLLLMQVSVQLISVYPKMLTQQVHISGLTEQKQASQTLQRLILRDIQIQLSVIPRTANGIVKKVLQKGSTVRSVS